MGIPVLRSKMRHHLHAIIKFSDICNALLLNLDLERDTNMMISATILNDNLGTVFEYHTEIDPLSLLIIIESRQDHARYKGAEWTENSINGYGRTFLDKFKASQEQTPDLQIEITDIVMAVWLHQSLFMGVKTATFIKTNLELKILSDGTVQATSHSSNFY